MENLGKNRSQPQIFAYSYTYGCAICRNEPYTGILNSGYLLSGTCRRVAFNFLLSQIFLHFGQFISTAAKFVTNG